MTITLRQKKKKKVVGIALAGVLAVFAITKLGGPSAKTTTTTSTTEAVARASEPFASSAWPAGASRTYRAALRSSNVLALRNGGEKANPLAGKVEIDGDLVLRSFGSVSGQIVLTVEWSAIKNAKVEALERSLSPSIADELRAAVAVAHVDADGKLASIGIVLAATPLARHVQRAVLTEVFAVIEGVWGKRDVIDTSIGRAQVKRTASASSFARTGYTELDAIGEPAPAPESKVESTGEAKLDANGALQHALCNEKVHALAAIENPIEHATSEMHLELTLASSAVLDKPGTLPETKPESIRPLEPMTGDQRKVSLEERATGVTAETVFADVRVASILPPSAMETEWVWHDSAWLELHPDEAAPLLERAERDLPPSGIAAAFDVVVVSGTPQAQPALLASLDRLRKGQERPFVTMLNHIAQLRAATPEVFAFLSVEYARATTKDRRRASAYALGAISRSSIESRTARDGHQVGGSDTPRCKGVECAAEHTLVMLERDLDKSTTDEDRILLLRALGNGGQSSSFKSVAKHASSQSAEVRRAVAASLRNMEGGPVIDVLLKLAADHDGEVASESLQSLFRKSLDTTDYDALETLVASLPEEAHLPLINGLTPRLSDVPQAASILTALMNLPSLHPKLRMQIEGILRTG